MSGHPFDPNDWNYITPALAEGNWEGAKELLMERDRRADGFFLRIDPASYTPLLYQGTVNITASVLWVEGIRVGNFVWFGASLQATALSPNTQGISVTLPTHLPPAVSGLNRTIGSFLYWSVVNTPSGGQAMVGNFPTGAKVVNGIRDSASAIGTGVSVRIGDRISVSVQYMVSPDAI